jgi:hypothetical protein
VSIASIFAIGVSEFGLTTHMHSSLQRSRRLSDLRRRSCVLPVRRGDAAHGRRGGAAMRPLSGACPVEVMMARSWLPSLFRKAFHIKGNDDLRWVSPTYGLQVF